jgi:hypothetical protein
MHLYSFYEVRFKNKKVDEWYSKIFIRLVNLILPIYYYVSGLFISREITRTDDLNSNTKYIISLTSFPVRINSLWLVIESLLRQNDKPDAIILWLYKGEFKSKSSLPKSLLKLEKWIHIKFCDENLMPHKKYFYTMKEYPKANIITVDDDVIYPPTLIENLKESHKKYPYSICSIRTRSIKISNGTIQPYIDWDTHAGSLKKSHKFQQIGVGGVLYPPNSLHEEVFNTKVLRKKALKADDLWLKVMALKNDTEIVNLGHTYSRTFVPVIIKDNVQLMEANIHSGQNDKIFNRLINDYGLQGSVFEEKVVF